MKKIFFCVALAFNLSIADSIPKTENKVLIYTTIEDDTNYYKWKMKQEEIRDRKKEEAIRNRIREIQEDTNSKIMTIMLLGLVSSIIIVLVSKP